MLKRIKFIWLTVLLFVSASQAFAQEDLPDLVERIKPYVVIVTTYDKWGRLTGQGTGFFVQPNLVVSNWHVISEAYRVSIITATKPLCTESAEV